MQCPNCQAEVQSGAALCSQCGASLNSATPATTSAASAYKSSFGDQFNAALIFWKMNLSDLVVLTLVFLLVCWIPIANIGFAAGYTRSILKVARGEGKAEVGDLFNAWDCFGNLLIYCILILVCSVVLNVVPLLGALASMALGFAALPGLYLIVDRGTNFGDAIKGSIAAIQANPVDWGLSYLVGYIVGGIGALLLFVGVIFTLPLGALIMALQYENSKSTMA